MPGVLLDSSNLKPSTNPLSTSALQLQERYGPSTNATSQWIPLQESPLLQHQHLVHAQHSKVLPSMEFVLTSFSLLLQKRSATGSCGTTLHNWLLSGDLPLVLPYASQPMHSTFHLPIHHHTTTLRYCLRLTALSLTPSV